jgi:CBS domain-containing protein
MNKTANLSEIIERLKNSGETIEMTPRELISYFGQERRTKMNVRLVKKFLRRAKVRTNPDFVSAYIDAPIKVLPIGEETALSKPAIIGDAKNLVIENDTLELAFDDDPVPRIQLLPAANKAPISVKTSATLDEAVTLMMLSDFDQLPIMNGPRRLEGVISWQSIGQSKSLGREGKLVTDYSSEKFSVIKNTMALFRAVPLIIANGFVFVKDKQNTICGLVTTTDIAEQFVTLSEPFLVLEQIENHVRRTLSKSISLEVIQKSIDISDQAKKVESISDLTFGQYVRLLEKPEIWNELNLNLDRATFVKRIEEVRRIRNDVMHFHPDGISEKDIVTLRETSQFFQGLSKLVF